MYSSYFFHAKIKWDSRNNLKCILTFKNGTEVVGIFHESRAKEIKLQSCENLRETLLGLKSILFSCDNC